VGLAKEAERKAEEHQHHRMLPNAANSLNRYGVEGWSAHNAQGSVSLRQMENPREER